LRNSRNRGEETISGPTAFKLYDTYGLSLDIVQDVAREEELKVDLAGYDQAMARQRNLSQESWKGSGEEKIPEVFYELKNRGVRSEFIGYKTLVSMAKVAAILEGDKEVPSAGAGEEIEVVLDQTPFYGEAGAGGRHRLDPPRRDENGSEACI
jgi:alanyl-tRNA synthetase